MVRWGALLAVGIAGLLLVTANLPGSASPSVASVSPPPNAPDEVTYAVPASYATFVQWWKDLEAAYPNYLYGWSPNQQYGLGQVPGSGVYGPYDLWYVRLTNESLGFHKPEVFFMGNPHGDERAGPISAYWFANWLLRTAFDGSSPYGDWLRWILDNREVYFGVTHNPYGFDRLQRCDATGSDLNREADFNGPGDGGCPRIPADVFDTVQGKTVARFLDDHQVRAGMDFHGGTRALLYAWGSTRSSVTGVSPITGRTWRYVPPDFYYYDVFGHRVGDFAGDFGGNFGASNVGTPPPIVMYTAAGSYMDWAYGADTVDAPAETPYVKYGPYPGAGALWITPEISYVKNPPANTYGGDTTLGWGIDVRRMLLSMIDIAQPYVRWHASGIADFGTVQAGDYFDLAWQVNGSLVTDGTYVQWGSDPDPVNNPTAVLPTHADFAGQWKGGTGWEGALDGGTTGYVWRERIRAPTTTGTYYFVARAQVDQRYKDVLRPDVYGSNSYLRAVKERTWTGWSEDLAGADGLEHMESREWWDSPILRVTVVPDTTAPVIVLRSPGNGTVIRAGTPLDFQIIDGTLAGASVSLDGGAPAPLPQPWDVSTSGWMDGTHWAWVTAWDKGGLTATRGFVFDLDSTPPVITLVGPPDGTLLAAGTVIDLEVTDAHLSEVLWSRGGGDSPLPAPYDLDTTAWPEGDVTVTITAIDEPGNFAKESYHYVIDANPPVITLLSPPNGSWVVAGELISFEVADVSTVTATWDDGGGSVPLSPTFAIVTDGWPDGPVTILVAATDAVGHAANATFSFTFDSTPPTVRLVSPADGAVVAPGTPIDFEVADANLVAVSYSVDSGPARSLPAPYDVGTIGWADQTYRIDAWAGDLAGNSGSVTCMITIDGVPPAILRSDAGAIVRPGHHLQFLITDDHPGPAWWSRGGPESPLAAPYEVDTTGWADGDYNVTVRAVDLAGNEANLTVAVTIDGTPPAVAAVSPTDDALARPGLRITFAATDLHLNATTVVVDGVESPLAAPYEVDTAGWADGVYAVEFRATDLAGNAASTSLQVTIDGTPPVLGAIQIANAFVGHPIDVSLAVTEPHGPTQVTLHWRFENGTWATLPMTDAGGGSYEAAIPAQNATGTLEVYVTAVDAPGNAAQTGVLPWSIAPRPQFPDSGILVDMAFALLVLLAVILVIVLVLRRRRSPVAEDGLPSKGDVREKGEDQEQKK